MVLWDTMSFYNELLSTFPKDLRKLKTLSHNNWENKIFLKIARLGYKRISRGRLWPPELRDHVDDFLAHNLPEPSCEDNDFIEACFIAYANGGLFGRSQYNQLTRAEWLLGVAHLPAFEMLNRDRIHEAYNEAVER